jgi:hypothetical protein
MNCASCGKPRHEIHIYKSQLFTNMPLALCNSCRSAGFEPRWMIILFGRQNGAQSVERYLKKHLYHGDAILATELL